MRCRVGQHSLAGEGVGGPNSDDYTETLVVWYKISHYGVGDNPHHYPFSPAALC
jgi:hypothetical protein